MVSTIEEIEHLKNCGINDFLYEEIDGNIHIVNAVSPAFPSCFALSEFIVDKLSL